MDTAQAAFGNASSAISTTAKLATRLNAGAAVVSGVFSGIDTVQNTLASFDRSKSTTERGEALIDANASLGGTLMSAGVVAAAIPGGQVAGAVLGATGAVLWGASKVTKWINKATGGAVGRTLVKARDAVVDSVKNVASSAWNGIKSLFGG